MNRLKIIFIRHGETDSNKKGTYMGWTDTGLNTLGKKQALDVGKKLEGKKIDRIYTSPLVRTSDTAYLIKEYIDADIFFSDKLKERNFGIWDNLTHQEIVKRYPGEYELWIDDWVNYCVKDGESAHHAYKRNVEFIEELIRRHSNGTVIIVTHLGCIRNMLSFLLGFSIEDTWRFRVDNGSITMVEITDGYGVLTYLNV